MSQKLYCDRCSIRFPSIFQSGFRATAHGSFKRIVISNAILRHNEPFIQHQANHCENNEASRTAVDTREKGTDGMDVVPEATHPDRFLQEFTPVTPGKCRNGSYELGDYLPTSFPPPYPGLKCLKPFIVKLLFLLLL